MLVKNALYEAGPLPTTTCNDLPDEPTTSDDWIVSPSSDPQ
ncbi:hypothetical protein ACNF49_40425 [Actinomadura sp. ATCC 39365]